MAEELDYKKRFKTQYIGDKKEEKQVAKIGREVNRMRQMGCSDERIHKDLNHEVFKELNRSKELDKEKMHKNLHDEGMKEWYRNKRR